MGKKFPADECVFCDGTGLRCPQLGGLAEVCRVCNGRGETGPHPPPAERVVDLNERRLEGA